MAQERQNLFVIPLDSDGRWYRYHHAVGELFRAHLARTQPERIPALHRRASDWFISHGLRDEAVHHAVCTGDREFMADTVEHYCSVAVAEFTNYRSIQRWLDPLDERTFDTRPALALTRAWCHVQANNYPAVEPAIARAMKAVTAAGVPEAAGRAFASRANTIRSLAAWRTGDHARTIALAEAALTGLPETRSELDLHPLVLCGISYAFLGDAERAVPFLDRAEEGRFDRRMLAYYLIAAGARTLIFLSKGEINEAVEYCNRALRYAGETGGGLYGPGAPAYIARAVVRMTVGEYEEAVRELTDIFECLRTAGETICSVLAGAHLALACWHTGDFVRMRAALAQAREDLRGTRNPTLHLVVRTNEVLCGLLMGDVALAAQYLGEPPQRLCEPPLAFSTWEDTAAQTRAWAALHCGQLELARQLVSAALPVAKQYGYRLHELEWRMLQAVVEWQGGHRAAAIPALCESVSQAILGGIRSCFHAHRKALAPMVSEVDDEAIRDYLGRACDLPATAGLETVEEAIRLPVPPAVPLSAREIEVLRCMALGSANKEIARRLHISVATVKTHVHNVIAKLGATTRTGAVFLSRRQGILS